ncbi:MAG: phosphoribosylglycinamide formyltransferase [Euryarchaeota archaeon]|nr:phosphoribosylglycinamide formyltransferase [Euryarchaeota archaeon]
MPLRVATPGAPLRLAVLASGSGSGMEALVRYQHGAETALHTTVVVVTDKANAGVIQRATALGCIVEVVPLPNVDDRVARRAAHEDLIQAKLESYEVEAVVLSGWMRLLTAAFVGRWKGRLVNIHPSLLPDFPGAHAHQDVLAAGATESGCTVHFVDAGMDTGPIIAQAAVPVHHGDDIATLAERVKAEEHRLYPRVLDALASGSISFDAPVLH